MLLARGSCCFGRRKEIRKRVFTRTHRWLAHRWWEERNIAHPRFRPRHTENIAIYFVVYLYKYIAHRLPPYFSRQVHYVGCNQNSLADYTVDVVVDSRLIVGRGLFDFFLKEFRARQRGFDISSLRLPNVRTLIWAVNLPHEKANDGQFTPPHSSNQDEGVVMLFSSLLC